MQVEVSFIRVEEYPEWKFEYFVFVNYGESITIEFPEDTTDRKLRYSGVEVPIFPQDIDIVASEGIERQG